VQLELLQLAAASHLPEQLEVVHERVANGERAAGTGLFTSSVTSRGVPDALGVDLARMNMNDGELSRTSNATLAVAFALVAIGTACGDVVGTAKPDGGTSTGGPDGGVGPVDGGGGPVDGGGSPLDLGGGGPALLDLTCPELSMPP